MWEKELEVCKEIAVVAGDEIMKVYDSAEGIAVDYKADNSPLTEADRASNRVIVDRLRGTFPDHAILSEEEKDNKDRLSNDLCFVIDPLDGTKEFIKRNGQFTVNIALSYKHRSVMGVIYVPVTKELYYAAQGIGAWKVTEEGVETRIHVSDITDINDIRVVMSSSHGCAEMDELLARHNLTNLIRIGSSLKGCMIAEGKAEVYYRYNPTMEWDTAAMQCIVEEAGAIFRRMDDEEMLYNREDSVNGLGFYIINNEKTNLKLL